MRALVGIVAATLVGLASSGCAGGPSAPLAEASVEAPWLSLPETPALPVPDRQGRVPVEGAELWYAEFGVRNGGVPVLLLHGGLANSNYFGLLIPALVEAGYHVIALDTRGHGRSTASTLPYGYALLAEDVVRVLDHLLIEKADIVGWSDGGTVGYQLGLASPGRVRRLLAFGANATLDGLKDGYGDTATFQGYIARSAVEYRALAPDPAGFDAFLGSISGMWATAPVADVTALSAIPFPVTAMVGQYDEALKLDHVEAIAAVIPEGTLVVLPDASHFALIQTPDAFEQAILDFLKAD